MRRTRRTLTVAAAALLAGAVPAAAEQIDVAVGPADAALGAEHAAQGTLRTDAGAPLADRRISLQARPYPFTGPWRPIAHATTDPHGVYTFGALEFDRNTDVRVVAFDGATSGIARAFTYPSHQLGYRVLGKRRIRLTQTYRTPRDVRLNARTLFYLGRGTAASAPVAARARTRRTSAGHFRATATLKLPKAWRGSFRYASCFGYSPRSGMGDPAQGCPRRYLF
jgi:hypothetical protein